MASPISAQQRSAEESRQEFDTTRECLTWCLYWNRSMDTFFIYKLVSKSMATEVVHGPFAYCLEFPINFIMKHGKKFDEDVTFGLEDSKRTWPIKLTVRSLKQSKPQVFAYGRGGWKSFLMDNLIKVGEDYYKSSAKWFRNTSP